jgi:hypothetical protein
MSIDIKNAPLPQLHSTGMLVSDEKQAEWWPEVSHQEAALQSLDDPRAKAGSVNPVQDMNGTWVRSAADFLVTFVTPVAQGSYSHRRGNLNTRGVISLALERIRDDNVIENTLDGLDPDTRAGINVGHQDVLAAVALLARVNRHAPGHGLELFEDKFEKAEES